MPGPEAWIVIGIIAFLLLLAFFKSNLMICPPNKLLVFSGRGKQGFRVLKGGRRFKWPIIESVRSMSLETLQVVLELKGALSHGLIPLHVKCSANVKVAGSQEDGLYNAVERFLGKRQDDIARIARETLEGSVRGVLSTLSPEDANTKRLDFARKVMEVAQQDFQRLGLVIDTFKVHHISDGQHYLEAIGRRKNAEVQRDARIAEARAEAEAQKVAAHAKKEGLVAEAEAQGEVVVAQNALRVQTAELDGKSNEAEARAQVVGDIARLAERTRLEAQRVELNTQKYRADVVIPAAAEQQARELKARGSAARIVENGKATAEALQVMREQWEQGESRELFLIQLLPDIVDKITRVVADNLAIEKLTIVDGGSGDGLPRYLRGLTGSMVSIFEEVKNATGLDIPELLKSRKGTRNGPAIPRELPD